MSPDATRPEIVADEWVVSLVVDRALPAAVVEARRQAVDLQLRLLVDRLSASDSAVELG